jgi:hypothetical protein
MNMNGGGFVGIDIGVSVGSGIGVSIDVDIIGNQMRGNWRQKTPIRNINKT